MEKNRNNIEGSLFDQSKNNADAYVVSRHEDAELETKLLEETMKDEPDQGKIKTLISGIKAREAYYEGIYFKNHFRVNYPIKITKLGFFGPFNEDATNLKVFMEIYRPKNRNKIFPLDVDCVRIGVRVEHALTVRPRDIFHVGFDEPIHIEPNTWHLIQFKLEGTSTSSCYDTLEHVPVEVGGRTVKFQFSRGSMQMPEIFFQL